MLYKDPGIESLAALHIVKAVLKALREKKILGSEEVTNLLIEAAEPLRGESWRRSKRAAALIDQVREQIEKGQG